MLDLVDEDRRAALEQPVVERAGAMALELLLRGSSAERASSAVTLRRDVTAHEDQLERAVQVDDERRLQALDQRGQRLGLRLGACVSSGRRAVRPVDEDPQLGVDPRWVGEGRARLPGRGREVAVEVDAGGVLPGSGEQSVGVEDGDHRPARLRGRDALQQPPHEQRRVRFLAVLGGGQEARDRPVSRRQEDAQRHPVTRAAVLLDAPAVELAAQRAAVRERPSARRRRAPPPSRP